MRALKESFVIQLSNKKNFHKKKFFFDMPKSGQIFKEALFVNSNRRLKRAKRHSPIFPTPTPPQRCRTTIVLRRLASRNICGRPPQFLKDLFAEPPALFRAISSASSPISSGSCKLNFWDVFFALSTTNDKNSPLSP